MLSGEARGAQTLTLDAPYATRVGELKGKMQAMGCAIPITRMRLVHQEKRFLLKDSNTLAFYNLASGTVTAADGIYIFRNSVCFTCLQNGERIKCLPRARHGGNLCTSLSGPP